MTDPRPHRTDPTQVDLNALRYASEGDGSVWVPRHSLRDLLDQAEQLRPLRADLDEARAAYVKAAGERYRVWEENEKLRAELDRVRHAHNGEVCVDVQEHCDRLRAANESLLAAITALVRQAKPYILPESVAAAIRIAARLVPGTAVDREAGGTVTLPEPTQDQRDYVRGIQEWERESHAALDEVLIHGKRKPAAIRGEPVPSDTDGDAATALLRKWFTPHPYSPSLLGHGCSECGTITITSCTQGCQRPPPFAARPTRRRPVRTAGRRWSGIQARAGRSGCAGNATKSIGGRAIRPRRRHRRRRPAWARWRS